MYDKSYTLKTLSGLTANTYILAIVVALAFVGISILVSNAIAYQGGKSPKDAKKRRVWFWVLSPIASAVFFLWNYMYVLELVKGTPAKNKFMAHNASATVAVLLLYILVGFVMSKLMTKRKYGTLFPKK